MDIDRFKPLNNEFTETKIDATILPEVQKLIRDLTQHRGEAYRHGGEEFVVILPNHDLKETCSFAEKIRATISAHEFMIDQSVIEITISVGVALWPNDGGDFDAVLSAANKAEHVAKESGRNRVESVSPSD